MRSLCLVFEATCLLHRQAVVWLTVLGESQTGGRSGACSSLEMRRAFCFGLHPGPLRLLVKVTPDGNLLVRWHRLSACTGEQQQRFSSLAGRSKIEEIG